MPSNHTTGAGKCNLEQQWQALREDVGSLAESLKALASASASDSTRHVNERA